MTKVLLVEDDKSLREIYAVRLVEEGYDIVSAGDGEEALAMAIKDRPNLIISDVMMPKISGFDMLDILRSTTETRDIKVIMMTALSSEDQRQRGVSLGADRYLVKSQVGIEDVVRTVHEVLGDAPVAGQAPLVSSPEPTLSVAPAPAPAPPIQTPIQPMSSPITPGLGAQPSAPVTTPQAVAPAPTPVAPVTPEPTPAPAPTISAPIPVSAPTPATPVSVPPRNPATEPQVAAQPTNLPEPTAPFSTPRTTGATLAGRVIEPLPATEKQESANMSTLMEKELSSTPLATVSEPAATQMNTPSVTVPPVPPVPPIPVAPLEPTGGLSFEETPRPATSSPQAPTGSSGV